jgi:hypothetical protein
MRVFRTGSRLRSQVCTTEMIVVRVGDDELDLRCGGEPVVLFEELVTLDTGPAPGLDTGTGVGKRYVTDDPDGSLELLVTKAGAGTLTIGATPLLVKAAKPLPSSD